MRNNWKMRIAYKHYLFVQNTCFFKFWKYRVVIKLFLDCNNLLQKNKNKEAYACFNILKYIYEVFNKSTYVSKFRCEHSSHEEWMSRRYTVSRHIPVILECFNIFFLNHVLNPLSNTNYVWWHNQKEADTRINDNG